MELNTLFEGFSNHIHKAESDSSDADTDLSDNELINASDTKLSIFEFIKTLTVMIEKDSTINHHYEQYNKYFVCDSESNSLRVDFMTADVFKKIYEITDMKDWFISFDDNRFIYYASFEYEYKSNTLIFKWNKYETKKFNLKNKTKFSLTIRTIKMIVRMIKFYL